MGMDYQESHRGTSAGCREDCARQYLPVAGWAFRYRSLQQEYPGHRHHALLRLVFRHSLHLAHRYPAHHPERSGRIRMMPSGARKLPDVPFSKKEHPDYFFMLKYLLQYLNTAMVLGTTASRATTMAVAE